MSQLHREFPEATPEEIESKAIGALIRAPRTIQGPTLPRRCRDCGEEFQSMTRRGGKFNSLCGWCIAHEL